MGLRSEEAHPLVSIQQDRAASANLTITMRRAACAADYMPPFFPHT